MKKNKIIDFIQKKEERETENEKIEFVYPESGFYEGLYYTKNNPDILCRMKILFWAKDGMGNIFSLVPFYNQLWILEEFKNKEKMCFCGYYDTVNDKILESIPQFKKSEIDYYGLNYKLSNNKSEIISHLLDGIGTHGVFIDKETQDLEVVPIHSWKLYEDGSIEPFVVRKECEDLMPILINPNTKIDSFILPVSEYGGFNCYFNYETALRLKEALKQGNMNINIDLTVFNKY